METPHIKLRKFDLQSEPNSTMNVETYFNNNWDKIDSKSLDLTTTMTENKELLDNKIDATKLELTSKITQSKEMLNAKIDAKNLELTSQLAQDKESLDTKIQNKSQELDTKIDTTTVELRGKIQEVNNELNQQLNDANVVPFSTDEAITNTPKGTSGMFIPKIAGVKPLYNEFGMNSGTLVKGGRYDDKKYDESTNAYTVTGTSSYDDYGYASMSFGKPKASSYYLAFGTVSLLNADQTKNVMLVPNNNNTYYELSSRQYKRLDTSKIGIPQIIGSKYKTRDDMTSFNHVIIVLYDTVGVSTVCQVQLKDVCVVEITGDEYNNIPVDQLIKKYHYVEGLTPPTQSYDFISRGKNLFDKNKVIKGKYPRYINGELSDNLEYNASEFIPIRPNANYYLHNETQQIAFYDNSKNFIGGKINPVDHFTTPMNAYFVRLTIHNNRLDTAMLVEGTTAPSTYTPHTSSLVSFTVPEKYPLVELPNGERNVIDENGDYQISCEYKKDVHLQTKWSINTKQPTHITFQTITGYLTGNASSEDVGTRLLTIGDKVFSIVPSLNRTDAAWSYTIFDNDLYINIPRTELETVDVKGLINWLSSKKTSSLIYRLSSPITLKDGEQGYKAPTSIHAYEDGDLLIRGMYDKVHTLTDSNEITLDSAIIGLDGVYIIKDNSYTQLAVDRYSDQTITLSQNYTGEVVVRGTLSSKEYINPIIEGNLPANLGTITIHNSKAITQTNEKVLTLEEKLDLLIVLNS